MSENMPGPANDDESSKGKRDEMEAAVKDFIATEDFRQRWDIGEKIAAMADRNTIDLLAVAMQHEWGLRKEFGPGIRMFLGMAYERIVGKTFWKDPQGLHQNYEQAVVEADGRLIAAIRHWNPVAGRAGSPSARTEIATPARPSRPIADGFKAALSTRWYFLAKRKYLKTVELPGACEREYSSSHWAFAMLASRKGDEEQATAAFRRALIPPDAECQGWQPNGEPAFTFWSKAKGYTVYRPK